MKMQSKELKAMLHGATELLQPSPASQTLHPPSLPRTFTKIKFPITEFIRILSHA